MIGTGYGDLIQILNVPSRGIIQFRARRITSLAGLSRPEVDFSDLASQIYEDMYPGDLVSPGGYSFDVIVDPVAAAGTSGPQEYLSLQDLLAIIEAAPDDLALHVSFANSLVTNQPTRLVSLGWLSDSGGVTSELNAPREATLTWSNRGRATLETYEPT